MHQAEYAKYFSEELFAGRFHLFKKNSPNENLDSILKSGCMKEIAVSFKVSFTQLGRFCVLRFRMSSERMWDGGRSWILE
jgi:hypothetical protein